MRILERDRDDEQLAIALKSVERSLLVIAGPGSAKTHLLTHVAAYQARRSHPGALAGPVPHVYGRSCPPDAHQTRIACSGAAHRRRTEVTNFHQLGVMLLGHHGHHVGWPRDAQVLDTLEAQELAKEVADELGLRAPSGKAAHDAISRLRKSETAESAAGTAQG